MSVLATVRNVLAALPSIAAALSWTILCFYFLIWYSTLPRLPSGELPRIGLTYALWPYISCIGAVRQDAFTGGSVATAIFIVSAFSVDYYLNQWLQAGIWWLRGKLMFGVISSAFLVALSYVSTEQKHLVSLL